MLKSEYLATYWALNKGLPLIVYLMDIETSILFIYFSFLQFLHKYLYLKEEDVF